MSKSGRSRPPISQEQPVPQFQFRGVYLPPVVLYHLPKRKIAATDLAILCIIEALTKVEDRGCFASNHYLGSQLGVTSHRISRVISKLIKLGLVISHTDDKGQRYLEVSWRSDYLVNNPSGGVLSTHRGGVLSTHTISSSLRSEPKQRINTVPPAGAGQHNDEKVNNMPLLPNTTIPSNKAVSTIPADKELATKLHEIIIKVTKFRRKWSLSHWAKQFAILRKEVQDDRPRIAAVLDWFSKNALDRYTPQVRCAESFRKKFTKLESAMQRQAEDKPEIEISDQAWTLVESLEDKGWPAAVREALPELVQLTMNNYREFLTKVHEVADVDSYKTSAEHTVLTFADHVLSGSNQLPTSPVSFAKSWLLDIHRWIQTKPDWQGKPLKFVAKVTSDQFRRRGEKVANDYMGNPQLWTSLLRKMGYENV